jgi:hypothetical protein
MVVTTRANMVDKAFPHIVITLLGIKEDSQTYECLLDNHVTDVFSLVLLNESAILRLKYDVKDSSGTIIDTDKQLPVFHQAIILIFRQYFMLLRAQKGSRLTNHDISDIKKDDWDDYRVSDAVLNPNPQPNVVSTSTTHSKIGSTNNDIANFMKGIKRDKSQYTELKDERYFEKW